MRRKRNRYKRKIIMRRRILFSIISLLVVIGGVYFTYKFLNNIYIKNINENNNEIILDKVNEEENEEVDNNKEITNKIEVLITYTGDCTLGTDTNFSYEGSFISELDKYNNDYSIIMRNVRDIFENDDYTIVNLETTFTDSTVKRDKGNGVAYHFKGPKEYVNILTSSSIEGVTVANNHIYDYGETGFNDTINILKENNVDYFGEGYKVLKDINGIKFGFLGYQGWYDSEELRNNIKKDIDELRNNGAVVIIPYFHWGVESSFYPIDSQISLGRYTIDCGADMVLGSHAHVIETLENYKGKLIAYGLGNFSFGGNFNPTDKRTIILQTKFELENEKLANIQYRVLPALISSVSYRNDYAPTLASGEIREEILNTLNELSPTMKGLISNDFFSILE